MVLPVRQRAFSLVELLIVTAIVAVLSGLLFTAGRQAVRAAKSSTCQAQLSNLWKALALYATDNDHLQPPYALLQQRNTVYRGTEYKASLKAYGMLGEQFYCPLDFHAATRFEGETMSFLDMSYTQSYLVLRHMTPIQSGYVRFSLDDVPAPASFLFFFDQTILTEDVNPTKNVRRSSHGDRLNCLYGDGHVKNERVTPPTITAP